MKRHKYANFVDILDQYKDKDKFSFEDRTKLDGMIENNFHNREPKLVSTYHLFDNSYNILSEYEKWQADNETDITPVINPCVSIKKINIDVNVDTLDDLIDIITNNQYEKDTEYNINLKMLHNVKDELIELKNMIGMSSIKENILYQILYFIQELHINGIQQDYKHTVIYGPPGTGKTEVAKIIGKMYSKMGILKNNSFKKVTRNDLVAGYLGQTAIKTKKVIDECLDGVLFIDEAYALATGEKEDSFSKECVDTLCECLSDNRDNLMVIIAGYENEINNKLFTINQGLSSRFIWRFSTDKYSSNELRQIFVKKINENNWTITVDSAVLEKWFKENTKEFEYFGRDIEILFTYVKITHGKRIYGENKDSKKKLNIEDLNNGLSLLIKNKKQKEQQTTIFGLYT